MNTQVKDTQMSACRTIKCLNGENSFISWPNKPDSGVRNIFQAYFFSGFTYLLAFAIKLTTPVSTMKNVVRLRSSTSPYSFCWRVVSGGHLAVRSWSCRLHLWRTSVASRYTVFHQYRFVSWTVSNELWYPRKRSLMGWIFESLCRSVGRACKTHFSCAVIYVLQSYAPLNIAVIQCYQLVL